MVHVPIEELLSKDYAKKRREAFYSADKVLSAQSAGTNILVLFIH